MANGKPGRVKGGPKYGGKKKGTPNKITKDVREAYQKLVEGNLGNMQKWIERTATADPAKALDIMIKMSEYFIPKLARTETSVKVEDNTLEITRKIIGGESRT